MNATLIGYFPKRTMTRPQWLQALGVEEICSVSECVSEGPEDWIQRWKHNDMWAYDTPELAWSIVPAETRREYQLYAYGMFPVEFVDGQKQIFVIPPLRVTPLGSSFRRLGYDIVCRSCGTSFECSPLSCNLMAEEVTVNRYCLVDDPETAFKLASEFGPQRCEPGPYVEAGRFQKHMVRGHMRSYYFSVDARRDDEYLVFGGAGERRGSHLRLRQRKGSQLNATRRQRG